jgi:hypothetical protein
MWTRNDMKLCFNGCGSFNDRREVTGEDWECRQQELLILRYFLVIYGMEEERLTDHLTVRNNK